MICPSCAHKNIPGDERCAACMCDLAPLDIPVGQDRIETSLMTDSIRSLQPKIPVKIHRDASLAEALEKLIQEEIGALLVVDDTDHLVGILSERDFLNKVVGIQDDYELVPLHTVMTPSPETIDINDSLALGLQKMDIGQYRHLPVLEKGIPVGIVSVRDALRYVRRLCRENG